MDSRADFHRVKKLAFDSALSEPSSFHCLLAVAATDLAKLKGEMHSEEAVKHHSFALRTINKRLSVWSPDASDNGIGDNDLAAVTLLAGYEVVTDSEMETWKWADIEISFSTAHPLLLACT